MCKCDKWLIRNIVSLSTTLTVLLFVIGVRLAALVIICVLLATLFVISAMLATLVVIGVMLAALQ